jgi:rubrerythrin
MHKRVQQLIIDNYEKQAFTLTPEELGEVWDMIEKHIELEKETIRLAEESRKNSKNFIVRYLLGYLMTDEQKHNEILAQMEDIKSGIYPYA